MIKQEVDWSLYLVADRRAAAGRSLVEVVRAAIAGGTSVVQLRDKEATTREMIALGRTLREVTRECRVPLIVNDRVDVALAVNADGVHVGREDMPAGVARALIGDGRLLGVSTETVDEARAAERNGADYLGVGDVFGTASKPDAGTPVGPRRIEEVVRAVAIPVVGIGGITPKNARRVIEAGAAGIAVISAVVAADDPEGAARSLRELL